MVSDAQFYTQPEPYGMIGFVAAACADWLASALL